MARGQGGGELAGSRCELRVGHESIRDAFAIERLDDRDDYGEERFVIVGMAEEHVLLFVAFVERGDHIPIEKAARADRDAQPLTATDFRRMKRGHRKRRLFPAPWS